MKRLIAFVLSILICVLCCGCMSSFLIKESMYLELSAEELAKLSDEKLYEAVWYRIENKVNSFDDMEEGFNSLNTCEKVFYAIDYLNMEVNCGGICTFFVNSSRMVAPYVSEYMEIIGAYEHKKIYDDFVSENKIDLNDLSAFETDNVEDIAALYERYPFDDFDDEFIKLQPLETYLNKYIRDNINDFS